MCALLPVDGCCVTEVCAVTEETVGRRVFLGGVDALRLKKMSTRLYLAALSEMEVASPPIAAISRDRGFR